MQKKVNVLIPNLNNIDNTWEYGTCWVKSPVTDKITTHKSRRNKENNVVQFYIEDINCDNNEGYWTNFNKIWWPNFIPKF